MMSTNLHSWQLAHNHQPPANYYLSRNMGDGHNNSAVIAHNTYSHEDPYLLAATNNNINGENIDDVFVIDDDTMFHTNRHLLQPHNHRQVPPNHYRNSSQIPDGFLFSRNTTTVNHLAPHNNSAFPYLWDPYSYHQFIDDVNQLIVTMQNLDLNFGSRLSGQPFDYRALLDIGNHDTEVGHQEENIIMMKKRTHCIKVEIDSEICAICLCEYLNDETIGTLECGHEYHASCIEQWLLRAKKNCPICRSSVLPSQQHRES